MNRNEDEISYKTLIESTKDIVIILGSMANERRLQMLTSLLHGSKTFKELLEVTGLGKTALAHHLGVLVKSGILVHVDKGRYELSHDGFSLMNAVFIAYAGSKRRRELEAAKQADYIQKAHSKQKDQKMKELKVKIVNLEPMRVASVRVISKTPEHDAWEKMRAWAEPKGLLEDIKKHPVFGFNNPDPSSKKEEYGYEFWIRVGSEIKPEGDIKIKEFEGGLYAVTFCKLKEEIESEFFQKEGYLESWKKIVDWVKSSQYKFGKHQALEKTHDPRAPEGELILDLYCPIKE